MHPSLGRGDDITTFHSQWPIFELRMGRWQVAKEPGLPFLPDSGWKRACAHPEGAKNFIAGETGRYA
jgi:hypothetical protein